MNKTGKRVLIGAIIVALVGGGAGGAYYLAKSRKSTPVSVYSMNDIGMDGYWGDEKQMSGRVTADKIQSVYVSTTQIIQEIMGPEVSLVNAGAESVHTLHDALARRQLLAPEGTGQALLCTSDRPEDFGQMARRFLQEEPTAPVRLVDIEGY